MDNQQMVFNNRLLQIILLAIIALLGMLMFKETAEFMPAILGSITLYILSRAIYFKLVFKRKWKRSLTALLFILGYIILFSILIFISVKMISPKVGEVIHSQDKILAGAKSFSEKLESLTGYQIFTEQTAVDLTKRLTNFIPGLINSTASIITNLVMMFFFLYYLLVSGKEIERYLQRVIPLHSRNVDALASETKTLIRASGFGIPIICIVQGITATIGYWIFGVSDWALWGFLTGVFAFFPVVGTMIIWVPLVIYMFASGHTNTAIFLTLYSVIITGNVDYLARMSLMKKMGDVHPVITVVGVIVGLNLFGFLGLIFGPLLVSYFIILVKIYYNEFNSDE